MSGLPWFKVASDFPGHPKTLRLCSLLKDPNAGMYVVRLLSYCATYAPDGRVPLDMVKQAAGWTKQRAQVELLTSSLRAAGFIVCTETHIEIHGWSEWNGAHLRKSAKDNARPNAKDRPPRAGFERGSGGVSSGPRAGDVDVEGEKKKQLPTASTGEAGQSTEPPPAAPPVLTLEAGGDPAPKPKARRASRSEQEQALEALKADLGAAYRELKAEEMDWPRSAWGELQAIRTALADDEEVKRRWCLFLETKFWPIKNVHKFREAFQHAKFQQASKEVAAVKQIYPSIQVFR